MIEFAVENIAAIRACMPLVQEHYEEIAQFKQVQVLDPDWESYDRIEAQGKLWVMTARLDGEMIGYIIMMVSYDLHYRSLKRAIEDVHFILPEHRKGILGYKMLARTKQAMIEQGAHTITFRTKANDSHALLFERLGGVLHDLVYTIVV